MQRIATYVLFGFACVLFALPTAAAEDDPIDWPTFQGNNARTGASDYPAITKPEIAWSTQVGIMGYLNCPVIDGNRVFVTSSGDEHNKPDERDGVYCLDMSTGEVLWHYKTPIDACGVSIDEHRVYAGDDAGGLHAIDRKSGQRVWGYEFNASVFGAPLRVGRLVVAAGNKGFIYAFDAETGQKRWSFHHDDAIRAGLSSDGTDIFATYLHGRLVCFDLQGKVRWSEDQPIGDEHPLTEFYASATITNDELYFTFALGFSNLPKIGRFDTAGEPVWINAPDAPANGLKKSFANIRSSPAVYQGSLLYADCYSNEMVWVDKTNGGYTRSLALGAPMFPQWPSVVVARDSAYVARHDGGLHAVDLQNNKRLWTLYLGSYQLAGQDALPKDIMPEGWKHCAWNPGVGKPLYATPAIAKDGTLVVGSGEGWLYCIQEAKKQP